MKTIHFSGLNGLRAIAAIAVVFSHATIAMSNFGLDSFLFGKYADGNPKATLLAGFGVSIFFALSGFLITYLLIVELAKTKTIDIKKFYIRRILRIWPLYFLYFILSLITLFLYKKPIEMKSILFYIFLAANIPFIFGGALGFLEHYWSLGVEEQFYSFWPWIIKLFKDKLLLAVTSICFSLIFLKILFRLFDITIYNSIPQWPSSFIAVTRFQCMLIGAIGAVLYYNRNKLFIHLVDNKLSQSICWSIIFLVAINKWHTISLLDNEIISIVTVFLIVGQIQKSNRIVNLNVSPFDFLGKISYGIYVIHPLVIFYLTRIIHFTKDESIYNYFIVYFLVFLFTFLFAYLSYHLFESRFLRLKNKYMVIPSANSDKSNI